MSEDRVPPLAGQTLEWVPAIDLEEYQNEGEVHNKDRHPTRDINHANVITSRVYGTGDTHKLLLDIDLPAQLLESTTPGHFHLYIDKAIPGPAYMKLLDALAEAGIIEQGYAGASKERGYTALRLPWIKKSDKPLPGPSPF